MRPKIRIGEQYGLLTVTGKVKRKKGMARTEWTCRCACGNETKASAELLRRGRKKSCGCARTEWVKSIDPNGQRQRDYTYRSYKNMMARCYDPEHHKYKYYGALGVTVCERWRLSFENFVSDMGPRPLGLTLSRQDPNGSYEPGNCKWETIKQQNQNRRNTLYVTISGQRETLMDACQRLGIPASVVRSRLSIGWTEAEAFTSYVRPKKRKLTAAPR